MTLPVSPAEPLETGQPMRRYVFPITTPPRTRPDSDQLRLQMLEALNSQNQLLLDLLAAVNGLTAALLCQQR